MITSRMKDTFWESVVSCLVEFHDRDSSEALKLVSVLRDRIETDDNDHACSEIVYHAEPFDIACDLAGVAFGEQRHLRKKYNSAYLGLLDRLT